MTEIKKLSGKGRATGDRWCLWPLAVVVGLMTLLAIATVIEPFLFMLPGAALAVPLVVVALSSVVAAGVFLAKGMWRRAVSAAMLPMTFAAMVINLAPIMRVFINASDHLRFWANSASYGAHIAALPREQGPRFVIFDWGGFFLNPVDLIYDESDEIGLPPEQRSKDWVRRRGKFYSCMAGAHRVGVHYYVVRSAC